MLGMALPGNWCSLFIDLPRRAINGSAFPYLYPIRVSPLFKTRLLKIESVLGEVERRT